MIPRLAVISCLSLAVAAAAGGPAAADGKVICVYQTINGSPVQPPSVCVPDPTV